VAEREMIQQAEHFYFFFGVLKFAAKLSKDKKIILSLVIFLIKFDIPLEIYFPGVVQKFSKK
jgi:hypothetical protein